jgi:methyl-accepting chemotaxis protein
LARQTASATETIEAEMGSIQAAAADSGTAIEQIGKTICSVDEVSRSILQAVNEQRAATREIGENIQQAASATRDVSQNIAEVNSGAQQTSAEVEGLTRAAGHLIELAGTLNASVRQLVQKSESRSRTNQSTMTAHEPCVRLHGRWEHGVEEPVRSWQLPPE